MQVYEPFKVMLFGEPLHEFCTEVVAYITFSVIAYPIAEISLIGWGHGRQIVGKIRRDLLNVLLTPYEPTVSVLVIVVKILHQGLLEIHGYALGKQLPNEVLATVIAVLIEHTVLLVVHMPQFVVDQSAHGILITPIQLENFFDAQQDHVPSVDGGDPPGGIAEAEIQDNINIQLTAKEGGDFFAQTVRDLAKGSMKGGGFGMTGNLLNDRQNILFIRIATGLQAFLQVVYEKMSGVFVNGIDVEFPFFKAEYTVFEQRSDLWICVNDLYHIEYVKTA